MFKEFVGRDVEVIIAFSLATVDGGSCPCHYFGVLNEVSEHSIKMSLTKIGLGFGSKGCNGELFEVNLKYVVSIREMN